jgi:hypothetical protein
MRGIQTEFLASSLFLRLFFACFERERKAGAALLSLGDEPLYFWNWKYSRLTMVHLFRAAFLNWKLAPAPFRSLGSAGFGTVATKPGAIHFPFREFVKSVRISSVPVTGSARFYFTTSASLSPCFVRASFANKQNSTAEVQGLGAKCLCVVPGIARCAHHQFHNFNVAVQDAGVDHKAFFSLGYSKIS